ncbi:MAG: hypothetical protein HZB46_13230 [Solirubrobacterales bacterium]|nr:hypothetical protein [Solirubrobacterales bacterium]
MAVQDSNRDDGEWWLEGRVVEPEPEEPMPAAVPRTLLWLIHVPWFGLFVVATLDDFNGFLASSAVVGNAIAAWPYRRWLRHRYAAES